LLIDTSVKRVQSLTFHWKVLVPHSLALQDSMHDNHVHIRIVSFGDETVQCKLDQVRAQFKNAQARLLPFAYLCRLSVRAYQILQNAYHR
jgi:hypothetical protein